MAGHWLALIRTIAFGIAADFITATTGDALGGLYFNFAALALAVSVLTWTTLPAMWFIDRKRRCAFTSFILVELVWLGILWVLWLAAAADSSANISGADCNPSDYHGFVPDWFRTGCGEAKAITAFGWLIWFALTGYLVPLLVLSISAHNKAAPVWKTSVRDATFASTDVNWSGAMGTSREPKTAAQHRTYPPST